MRYSHGRVHQRNIIRPEKTGGKIEGQCQFCTGGGEAETALYLPDRLGVSLFISGEKEWLQTPDEVSVIWGALAFCHETGIVRK